MKITDLILPATFAVSAMLLSPGLPAADEPNHFPIEDPAKDPARVEKEEAKPSAESKASDPLARILAKETGVAFEASFLDLMSQHHHVGIRMAGLATTHTENTALKALAATMVQRQGQEADQMEKWLREWHKQAPRVQKTPEDVAKEQEKIIGKLDKAKGAEFDKEFAKAMIHHDGQAIALAGLGAERSIHAELKALAASLIKQNQADIQALELIAK